MNLFYKNDLVTLYHGDCLEVMPGLNGPFDACIVDLPYQITSNRWDIIIPFDLMWEQLGRLVKGNGVKVFTASQPFTSKLVCSNIDEFRHEWIWQKNRGSNFANTVREPFKEHEEVLVFCRQGNWTYNKQMQERAEAGKNRANYKVNFVTASENYRQFDIRENVTINEMRVPSSIQKFNIQTGLHPTQKPVDLIKYLVRTYTNEGEGVLDFCAGSGTTGEACMDLNRKCVLIEKEEKYCEIIAKRLCEYDKKISGRLF